MEYRFSYLGHEIYAVRNPGQEPWFLAADILDVLGLRNLRGAVQQRVGSSYVSDFSVDGRPPETFVNYDGAVDLLLHSSSVSTENFLEWIYDTSFRCLESESAFRDGVEGIKKKLDRFLEGSLVLENSLRELGELLAPRTRNRLLWQRFALLKLRDGEYYVVRCQKRNYERQLGRVRALYPDCEAVLLLDYHANPVNLRNVLMEKLRGRVEWNCNHLTIIDETFTESQLVDFITANKTPHFPRLPFPRSNT